MHDHAAVDVSALELQKCPLVVHPGLVPHTPRLVEHVEAEPLVAGRRRVVFLENALAQNQR